MCFDGVVVAVSDSGASDDALNAASGSMGQYKQTHKGFFGVVLLVSLRAILCAN